MLMCPCYFARKHGSYPFQNNLHGGLGNRKTCTLFAQGPCWGLMKLGIDSLHYLLGDWGPLYNSSGLDISSTAEDVDPGQNNVASRGSHSAASRWKVAPKAWYGLRSNVPDFA